MAKECGLHVQYPRLKKKTLTTDLMLLASKGRRDGLLANLRFCYTLRMLEKAGKGYLLVLSFLEIWSTLKQLEKKVLRWLLMKVPCMLHQTRDIIGRVPYMLHQTRDIIGRLQFRRLFLPLLIEQFQVV